MSARTPTLIAATVLLIAGLGLAMTQLSLRPGDPAGPGAGHAAGPPTLDLLPAAKDEVVLDVRGAEKGNDGAHRTRVDFATLDGVATSELSVHEPFVKKDITFTGIAMRDLLPALGVTDSTKALRLRALDDYSITLPIAGLSESGFLAVRQGGKKIPIAEGGPIRIVYAGESELGRNTDNWIWSLDRIRVEG